MSPASYLTAPPRVAVRIIARLLQSWDMPLVWVSLAVSVVAVAVTGVRAGRLGWARSRTRAASAGRSARGSRRSRRQPRGSSGRPRRWRVNRQARGGAGPLRGLAAATRGAQGRARRGRVDPRSVHAVLPAQVTRVAAVDLGTNSTRLLVADVVGGRARGAPSARRGSPGSASAWTRAGVLLPAAIERVHACLADYRRTLEELGAERTLAVGTSAVRDAANGGEFLQGLELPHARAER